MTFSMTLNHLAGYLQVWKGLEDTIDGVEPASLSEAVVKAEEWLQTHSRSKVFAVFNAEVG